MTVTEPLAPLQLDRPWTIDDLDRLPEGMRYELVDGSLVVSPQPALPHIWTTYRLRRLVEAQAPPGLAITEGAGVTIEGDTTYFVPDLFAVPTTALQRPDKALKPKDMLLVVEVLSPSNSGHDLVTKRHYYAAGGIPRYWIVDPTARTLTVLELDGDTYREEAVVGPGTTWTSDQPFPLVLDPGEFL